MRLIGEGHAPVDMAVDDRYQLLGAAAHGQFFTRQGSDIRHAVRLSGCVQVNALAIDLRPNTDDHHQVEVTGQALAVDRLKPKAGRRQTAAPAGHGHIVRLVGGVADLGVKLDGMGQAVADQRQHVGKRG